MTSPQWILTLSANDFLARIKRLPDDQKRQLLRLRLQADPELFASVLLGHHHRLPFAPMHRRLFSWHREMASQSLPVRTGKRYALAAPRGSAKSTIISLTLLLHDILFQREQYLVLLSATERQARARLKAIRSELESGKVASFLPTAAAKERRYSAKSLTVGGILIEGHGAGTEIRGVSHHSYRPTKIILDDAESSRVATSPRARQRIHEWFAEIVEYLGDTYTHIIAIGTILHRQSLLAALLDRPDFTGKLYRSIENFPTQNQPWEEWRRLLLDRSQSGRRDAARSYFTMHQPEMVTGAAVLWPEKEDIEELMSQLVLHGRRSFYQEKQNEPLGPEDALFEPHRILRSAWKDETLLIQTPASDGSLVVAREVALPPAARRRFAYLDAALGKGGRTGTGDFCALAVVLLLEDGTLVAERLWARRISPSEQVQRLFNLHEEAPFERLAVEGTGFQELYVELIEQERTARRRAGRRADLPVETISPKKSKASRITGLEPLFSNGTLVLAEGLDEEFWEELNNWPHWVRVRFCDYVHAASAYS